MAPPAENRAFRNLGERLQYRLALLVLVFFNVFSINLKPFLSISIAKILQFLGVVPPDPPKIHLILAIIQVGPPRMSGLESPLFPTNTESLNFFPELACVLFLVRQLNSYSCTIENILLYLHRQDYSMAMIWWLDYKKFNYTLYFIKLIILKQLP